MKVETLPDEDAAAARGAELIADAAAERGSFSTAVSGGRTPWQMIAMLADRPLPWESTEIFQVDERIAAPGSPERNLTHLVAMLPIERQGVLRPMPVTSRDLEAAAREYEGQLPERLDIVHLGLGPDGHTASLVPGDPVLEVRDRRVALTDRPCRCATTRTTCCSFRRSCPARCSRSPTSSAVGSIGTGRPARLLRRKGCAGSGTRWCGSRSASPPSPRC